MQLCHQLSQIDARPPTVLSIGTFDGLHIGHQHLIRSIVDSARVSGRRSALVTFFPSPSVVLGRCRPCYLATPAEKLDLLERLGLDLVVIIEFTMTTAQISARDFITQLKSALNLTELRIGYDFALGSMREGDVFNLRALGNELGFSVHQLSPVLLDGKPVSSTRIRAAIRAGDLAQASHCLGRPYRLTGKLIPDQPTTVNGMPDANLYIDASRAVPSDGTYVARAHIDRGIYPVVAQMVRSSGEGDWIKLQFQSFNGAVYGQSVSLDLLAALPAMAHFELAEPWRVLAEN